MQKPKPPIEKGNMAKGYYVESFEQINELLKSKSKQDFIIQSLILSDTSESSRQSALQIRGDYFEQEILSGSYTIYLYEEEKVLGHFRYQDKEKSKITLKGKHKLEGQNLIIYIEDLSDANISLYQYFILFEISSKTIEHFKNTIFKNSTFTKPTIQNPALVEFAEKAFKILNDNTDYAKGKNLIQKYFQTTDGNYKDKIFIRLTLIDSFYSTQMDKRLFGIDDLVESFYGLAKSDLELRQMAEDFIANPIDKPLFKLISANFGINKDGKTYGKASSLITKYLYFLTNYNFPIFDGLVKNQYPKIRKKYFRKQLPNLKIECDLNFFIGMKELNEISGIRNFDKLDNLLWLTGKIEKNSFQLILNKENYLRFAKVKNRIRAKGIVEYLKSLRKSKYFEQIFHKEMTDIFDLVIQLNK